MPGRRLIGVITVPPYLRKDLEVQSRAGVDDGMLAAGRHVVGAAG
jgi:hypothetical protein